MLPGGMFPRFAIGAALLLALLLVLDIELVRTSAVRLLASNSLLFVAVGLAALCCLRVALRSSGFPRQIWLLLAIAFAVETLAQGLSSYYQSFVPGSIYVP